MTTTIKTCFKCNVEKPITDFYVHPAMGDGPNPTINFNQTRKGRSKARGGAGGQHPPGNSLKILDFNRR